MTLALNTQTATFVTCGGSNEKYEIVKTSKT